MKFSMMTYTMMRQKCYTPEDCVRVAKELDMDGIDWVTTYDRDARELKKLSDDAGLPVVAHTFFLRKDDMPQLESVAARHLDDAVTLGAPVVMIPPSPHPDVTTVEECRKLWIGILKKELERRNGSLYLMRPECKEILFFPELLPHNLV